MTARRYRSGGRLRVALPAHGKLALSRAHHYLQAEPDAVRVACPCGSGRDLVVTESDRHGLPYHFNLCEHCGLLRMSPQPSQRTLEWFYSQAYRDLYGPHGASDAALFASKTWKSALVDRALSRAGITIDGTVVDIGCGGGWTLHNFAERGQRSIGYDFDPRLLELGRTRGLELRLGGMEQALIDRVQADLLICGHVLEHVPDPEAHLRNLIPLLAPNGVLYLEVPHVQRIGAHLGGDALLYWQRAHLWEFQREHVVAFAARAGLTTVWSDEDADHAYVLCKVGAPASASWPALGAKVLSMLQAFEQQRRRPSMRIRQLGARLRAELAERVPVSVRRALRRA